MANKNVAVSLQKGIAIDCNRQSHRYRVGEDAQFAIRCGRKKMTVEFSTDGERILQTTTHSSPAVIRFGLAVPGFLRCTVRAAGEKETMLGVAFDPDQLRPALPEPEDFDAFWDGALDKLDRVNGTLAMQERKELAAKEFSIYDLACDNVNGHRTYGYLKLPKTREKLPLLVYVEGAGPGQCLETFQQHCATAEKFLKTPVALLTIGVHAYGPAEKQPEHQAQHQEYLKKMGLERYWLEHLDDALEDSFFYRAILGCKRMCDLVSALPQMDPARIAYLGASQGGGFGIYLTSLCPQIKAAFSGVPAFGDCGGFLIGRHPTQSNIPELRSLFGPMRYFDAANFARRIQVPVFMSAGFIDTACPPSSVYVIYNELRGPKMMFDKVRNGHGDAPMEYEPLTWFFVAQHLGL